MVRPLSAVVDTYSALYLCCLPHDIFLQGLEALSRLPQGVKIFAEREARKALPNALMFFTVELNGDMV